MFNLFKLIHNTHTYTAEQAIMENANQPTTRLWTVGRTQAQKNVHVHTHKLDVCEFLSVRQPDVLLNQKLLYCLFGTFCKLNLMNNNK